ncbi:hypothetical protein D3C78_1378150 [compost metagenome]
MTHAAAELMGHVVGPLAQAHHRQHFLGPGAALGRRGAAHLQTELDVLDHPPVGQQAEVLEHHGDPGAAHLAQARFVQRAEVLAVKQDAPGAGLVEAIDAARQSRFARAGQAHDHVDRAGRDAQRHVVHAHHLAQGVQHLGATLAFAQHR